MAKQLTSLAASTRQMLVGLDGNTDGVVKRGVTPEFIKNGKSLLERLESLQAEQESMKATLKTQQETAKAALKAQQDSAKAAIKTKKAAIKITIAQLRTWQSQSSRVVKRAYRDQQEKWVDFGIKVKFAKPKKKKSRK